MIVITGAAGFIGSCLIARLNEEKNYHLMLVDDFSFEKKRRNYESKRFLNTIDRNEFLAWWDLQHESVDIVFHLGARTDTTEPDENIFNNLNVNYSQEIWKRCVKYNTPLIYASSAATYGAGEFGYDDDQKLISKLKPLNPYGKSKNDFDNWVLRQTQDDIHGSPPFWCGLKFFNVFGPNEFHKGRMASVVMHGYNQIQESGTLKLFRSHKPEYENGKQLRDFIYVKDVVDVMLWLMKEQKHSGIYNLGSGTARSFSDLANATFAAMSLEPKIDFIDIPEDIRNWYQYFTEAKMEKLRSIGFSKKLYSLEEGVKDYVQNYLMLNKIW
ncbi:MAG: ADP-glyceromanno-heptose 6-epimerase [Chitinophagales bacterium]|nr:ADP-glyceromanno-heptose 6-epimerase [Chitinophagales bacterium]